MSCNEADGRRAASNGRSVPAALADACHERGALTLEQVWQVGLQIADALGYAHERGVIHRDVKPSNILRTTGGLIKLIDFGIAKLQPDASLELTPVRHPTIIGAVGTPGYIPPEAAEQVDARTDIFGLGRTLYRLITRRSVGDAPAGLQDTPEPLRRIVLAAMHADPESRIASAAEFRKRWLEAGERVWPRVQAGIDHPAPQVWPPPADQVQSPRADVVCAGVGAVELYTTSAPPRLFERRLELRSRLGGGRCGQTWRAYHHLLGRDVAVKIVPRELAQGEIVAGLCREAMALDKLTHRAFPRVLECDYTADGSWYMVEEFIDGETLAETFSRGRLDPLAAVDLVAEIAGAHPDFAVPELLRGERKSAASDVYALGVVLFILLTGWRSGAKEIRDIFADGEPDEAGERLREILISLAPRARGHLHRLGLAGRPGAGPEGAADHGRVLREAPDRE